MVDMEDVDEMHDFLQSRVIATTEDDETVYTMLALSLGLLWSALWAHQIWITRSELGSRENVFQIYFFIQLQYCTQNINNMLA